MRQLILAVAALCCVLFARPCLARPFTVDDLLSAETLTSTTLSPDGRWLVIQSAVGQLDAPRFDYDTAYTLAASRLRVVDLDHPAEAMFVGAPSNELGMVAGAFSPSGQRMLIHRLNDHRWESGVLDLSSRKVTWLGVGADIAVLGRTAAWLTDDELVLIARSPGQPHLLLRRGSEPLATLGERWRATAEGQLSATTIGSGRFLSRGGQAVPAELVHIRLRTGDKSVLARGDLLYLSVSSGGRYVAVVEEGADIQPGAGDVVFGGTAMRRRNLMIADLTTGAVLRPCVECDLAPFLLAWSPTDERLLIQARKPGQSVSQGRLIVVTPSPAEKASLHWLDAFQPTPGQTNEGFEIPHAGWVESRPIGWGSFMSGQEARWRRLDAGGETLPGPLAGADRLLTSKQGLVALAEGQLLSAVPRHAAKLLTSDFTALTNTPPQAMADGLVRIAQATGIVGQSRGRIVRLENGKLKDLGPTTSGLIMVAANGGRIINDRDAQGVVRLFVERDGRRTLVATLNPQFAVLDVNPVRAIPHPGVGGKAVTSWVLLPPNWRPGDRPPVVVVPYPGRAGFSATRPPADLRPGLAITSISAQLIASQGYAVLYPDLPSSRSDDPSEGLAAGMLSAVDAADRMGLVDGTKVALWGHSFGGYAVLAAAAQSSRFKAVIASAAIADQFSAWGQIRGAAVRTRPEGGFSFTAGMGYLETGQMKVGAPPWVAPERYIKNSPYLQAARVTAPVLLLTGEQDLFSSTQSEEMFSALYRQGKDAKLVTFWGEGHVVLSPANVRRLYDEGLGFLGAAFGAPASPGQALDPSTGPKLKDDHRDDVTIRIAPNQMLGREHRLDGVQP
ncbi:S9 family peptidase [Caulobacter hibisci]|uniref:S9 family peptidase n=1 Tax=Caulobacter hibisci TaxID=2035993 RepID=A0ABS0T0X5_9CAUL|nr:S9 family peptidase [Caulobacter hibisci]